MVATINADTTNGVVITSDTSGEIALQANGVNILSSGVSSNTSLGTNALASNTSGSNNTVLGKEALFSNTTGSTNTAVGYQAAYTNTTGTYITAVGYKAAFSQTANEVTAVGHRAGEAGTTGTRNCFIGPFSSYRTTTASDNTSVGSAALSACTTGSTNTAVGRNCLATITNAASNTGLGYHSLIGCTGSSNTGIGHSAYNNLTTGSYNIAMGQSAGSTLTTGAFCTYIGHGAAASGATVNHEMYISSANGGTGKGSNTGFINPQGGGVYQGNNSSTWSTTSDARLKKNIVDNTTGLDAIKQIQVKNFEYRTQDEVTDLPQNQAIDKQGIQLGVIAQEIQQVLPDMVKEESTGVLSVDPDNMTWYLVNAVKELSAKVEELQTEINVLKGE